MFSVSNAALEMLLQEPVGLASLLGPSAWVGKKVVASTSHLNQVCMPGGHPALGHLPCQWANLVETL